MKLHDVSGAQIEAQLIDACYGICLPLDDTFLPSCFSRGLRWIAAKSSQTGRHGVFSALCLSIRNIVAGLAGLIKH